MLDIGSPPLGHPVAPSIPEMPSPLEPRPYQRDMVRRLLASSSLSALGVAAVGAGKTIIIAGLVTPRLSDGRVLIATHSGELVEQNARTIVRQCPGVPIGILAGSLGRREFDASVVVGNIASIHRHRDRLLEAGEFATVIVDEAHRIDPAGTQYAETLATLRDAAPDLQLFGLTGSPWRAGHGHIAKRGRRGQPPIFDEVAAEISHADLLAQGFLSPVRPRRTKEAIDLAGVELDAFGDFAVKALDERVNRDDINRRAIAELVAYGTTYARNRWLIFATTIAHAQRLAAELQRHGIAAGVISARTPARERSRLIAAFRGGEFRALVNVACLTTGFDVPEVDLIGLIRPTRSRVLFYQMLGRGTRLAPGKADCVVLDFAGSTLDLGRIENIDWSGEDTSASREYFDGDQAGWACDACNAVNDRRAATCDECGSRRHRDTRPPVDREKGLSATDLALGSAEPRTIVCRSWSAKTFLAKNELHLQLSFSGDGGPWITHALWFGFGRNRLVEDWRRFGGRSPAPWNAQEALARFHRGELEKPELVVARPVERGGKTYWNACHFEFPEEHSRLKKEFAA